MIVIQCTAPLLPTSMVATSSFPPPVGTMSDTISIRFDSKIVRSFFYFIFLSRSVETRPGLYSESSRFESGVMIFHLLALHLISLYASLSAALLCR